MSKILTLAATGLVGLVLGAGIGVAAAGQGTESTPERTVPVESMDQMHAAMRDQMPAELVEQCDAMHASMPEGMADLDPSSMMGSSGSMGSIMGDAGFGMPGDHAAHHQAFGR